MTMKSNQIGAAMCPAWRAQAYDPLPSSSRPMREGLGRLARMRSALELLPIADRRELLDALDEISRPMTAREIDQALIATGLSRGDRKRLTTALKDFPILMVAH